MNMGLLLFNTKSKKNEKHIVNEHGVAFVQYKEQKEYDRWNGVDWQKGQKKKTMTLTSITIFLSNQNPYKPNDLG